MHLEFTKQTRENFTALIKQLTVQQVNTIPEGYKNNIIWNYGHNIITQQLLCYKLAGVAPRVSKEYIELFKKDTVPTRTIEKVEIESLIEWSTSFIESFETDLTQLDFSNFTSYTTSFNVTLHSVEEAVAFNSIHEGLHFGYAMAQRKWV